MAREFDIGPLTWVKDQIDQSLNTVKDSLNKLNQNHGDTAPIRFAQTHLYQVSGALDMVGLEGCKLYVGYLEKLCGLLDSQTVEVNPKLIEDFISAVDYLKAYLDSLLGGAEDVSLNLYESLTPIVAHCKEEIAPSDLFFPNLDQFLPKSLPTQTLAPDQEFGYVAAQRQSYQKGLLDWLTKKDQLAVANMASAAEEIAKIQKKSSDKNLWWSSNAFLKALQSPALIENPQAKKVCRKIDQEIKSLVEKVKKPHTQLLREMLYFLALVDSDESIVKTIKDTFDLHRYLPSAKAHVSVSHKLTAEEKEFAFLFKSRLGDVKDYWGVLAETVAANRLISLDQLEAFAAVLATAKSAASKLTEQAYNEALSVFDAASDTMRQNSGAGNYQLFIEGAALLNTLDKTIDSDQTLNDSEAANIAALSSRIYALNRGEMLAETVLGELDPEIIKAVAVQITESLKQFELILDGFFRAPEDKSKLPEAIKHLHQASAAFEMLNLRLPIKIVAQFEAYVNHFLHADQRPTDRQFEQLAEASSVLDFYVEELPRVRPEFEATLESVLSLLEEELDSLQLTSNATQEMVSDSAEAPISPSDIATLDLPEVSSTVTELVHTSEDASSSELLLPTSPSEIVSASSTYMVTDCATDIEMLHIYLSEAEEVLAANAEHLQALKLSLQDDEAMKELRRGFHTLKGSGRMVGLQALGDTAGHIEKMLNGLLDRKQNLTLSQCQFIEQMNAVFAAWMAELSSKHEVQIATSDWEQKILAAFGVGSVAKVNAAVAMDAEAASPAPVSTSTQELASAEAPMEVKLDDEVEFEDINLERKLESSLPAFEVAQAENELPVLETESALATAEVPKVEKQKLQIKIGDRTISPALFRVFQKEAKQNVGILHKVVADLGLNKPADIERARIAAHTLASNAGTVGFTVFGELTRSLEYWLDQREGQLNQEEVNLFSQTVTKIEQMAHSAERAEIVEGDSELVLALRADPSDNKNRVEDEATQTESVSQVGVVLDEVIDLPLQSVDSSNNQLLAIFMDEAKEIMPEVNSNLAAWHVNPAKVALADQLQRHLHTLKGSARMAGLSSLGDSVHQFEDHIVQTLKRKTTTADDFDKMFQSLDLIGSLLDRVGTEPQPQAKPALIDMATEAAPTKGRERAAQFLRMRAEVLDRLINEAGEVSISRSRLERELDFTRTASKDLSESITRLRAYLREIEIEAETQLQSRMSMLQETNETFDPLEFDRFTRLQELTRLMAESVNDVSTFQTGFINNLDQAEAALQQQARMNRDLQQGLMGVRQIPFAQISERLQRIVRQTARDLKKKAEISIEGENLEIDRGVLDKLGAPLEHLLRNAVAHGVELSSERVKIGKAPEGKVSLKVSRVNDEIAIILIDDGAGVNLTRVQQKAVELGLIQANMKPSEQQLMEIMFTPGFSTSTTVDQVSGRGVGLDAVRNDVASLGGRIDVSSQFGRGTTFSIYLPISQSVAQMLMVRAGEHQYAIPVTMVEQALKPKAVDFATAKALSSFEWAGNAYPLHDASELLGEHASPYQYGESSVLLLRSGAYRIALLVDQIVGNQEIVLKPIGPQVTRVPGIVGASVQGDGQIVLVLNPVQLANRETLAAGRVQVATTQVKVRQQLVALVVDDSLTMRKVLGRLLERDNYLVHTAKDGMDAIQILQTLEPDIILTDIEMPKMDGFGLARNIRDDFRTANTPLIMISSRTADKHQTLAKQIGVDAFFGKPVNDEDLLGKMKELIENRQVVH